MPQQPDNEALDRLKTLWNKDMERRSADPELLDPSQLLQHMQQQVQNTLQGLRRNLAIEIVSSLAILAALYLLMEYLGRHFSPLLWAGIVLITVGYHSWLYFRLSRNQPVLDSDLKSSIDQTLRQLKPIVDMGRWGGWVLAVLLVFGGINLALKQTRQAEAVLVGLLMAFAAAGAVFAVKYYIERLYGRHFKRLSGLKQGLGE